MPDPAEPRPGRWLLVTAWAGTVIHAVLGIGAVFADGLRLAHLLVAGVLFLAGSAAMLVAFGFAVARSTREAIGMGGLYFLAGSAPPPLARSFRLALLVQVLAAVGLAVAAPFTSLAFATLVPVWALGLMGVWGGRHGTFALREDARRRPTKAQDQREQAGRKGAPAPDVDHRSARGSTVQGNGGKQLGGTGGEPVRNRDE